MIYVGKFPKLSILQKGMQKPKRKRCVLFTWSPNINKYCENIIIW